MVHGYKKRLFRLKKFVTFYVFNVFVYLNVFYCKNVSKNVAQHRILLIFWTVSYVI